MKPSWSDIQALFERIDRMVRDSSSWLYEKSCWSDFRPVLLRIRSRIRNPVEGTLVVIASLVVVMGITDLLWHWSRPLQSNIGAGARFMGVVFRGLSVCLFITSLGRMAFCFYIARRIEGACIAWGGLCGAGFALAVRALGAGTVSQTEWNNIGFTAAFCVAFMFGLDGCLVWRDFLTRERNGEA
jgi:hypothetical protein